MKCRFNNMVTGNKQLKYIILKVQRKKNDYLCMVRKRKWECHAEIKIHTYPPTHKTNTNTSSGIKTDTNDVLLFCLLF